ncbi:TPA: ead/Ea22-like family protein [Escherichia coli]|nr:ead/Ea22-like family protein [Escherichia coli]EIT7476939.1 ead/Ea22-like family protein [Escherichia coli]ELU2298973.1 ead/Ea22-like family protein [Escherichia coli]HAN3979378.1 ead/Ea22-like family protein [Escherichia coli]
MSKIDYQALREAAEKATWGDWDSYKPHRGARGYEVRLSSQAIAQHVLKNNAEFIAAFNPKIALALLDERERNQQYIKSRDQENEEIALTVGKLRVELEGKDKLIAELGKQCAEWERKALSNFEECAAMAERIEEMSKQSCEARERDLFESWVMHSICISKSTLEGLRTETGYRNATLSGTDFNRMWKQWKSIRAAGIRIKGE